MKLNFVCHTSLAAVVFAFSICNSSTAHLTGNSQTITATKSDQLEVVKLQTSQPILVSVSPNWADKLPSVRNRIIGELEGRLGRALAQGNRGSARVEALRVEGSALYVKVLIHHRHEPKKRFGVYLGIPYSLQTWIETRFNPLDAQSTQDRTKLCVRGPNVIGSPNLCVTAGEVVKIAAAFL